MVFFTSFSLSIDGHVQVDVSLFPDQSQSGEIPELNGKFFSKACFRKQAIFGWLWLDILGYLANNGNNK